MAGVKQEVINTFEEGLNKDLNPINTPNNVLTDCLNGTIITYDGNEYQLQNDKGNYPLKYCKLKKDYVPVGTASYGDILYIISYNPITKTTEIGTFPSPAQHLIPTTDRELDAPSILHKYEAENSGDEVEYNTLIEKYYQLIQFGATEDYKLYPGDSYKINDVEDGYAYETIHYFIITDSNEIIEITDQINKGAEDENDPEYRYVTWEVPGWLAIRWDLPLIEDFKIFPKSINPETGSSKINYQITSNDKEVLKAFKDNNLEVETKDIINQEEPEKSIDEYDTVRYFNLTYPITFNVKDEDGNIKDTLTIKARPTIQSKYKIKYPEAEPYIIDLSNRFSEENTNIANEYFTYSLENNLITFNFDIDASIVTTGEVSLKLSALPFIDYMNANYSLEEFTENDWYTFESGENVFDGIGQQIIQTILPENLQENIFILKISLSDGLSTINCYKTVIASSFMNNFTKDQYNDFSLIPVSVWGQYLNAVEIKFNKDSFIEPTYTKDGTITINSLYDKAFWNVTDSKDTSAFFPEDSRVFTTIDKFKYELGYKASGGHVSGEIVQKYLKNFCDISFNSEETSYTVTGSTNTFQDKTFDFVPDSNINPYAEQEFSAKEDLSELSATTANFSNKELIPAWNGKNAFSFTGLKEEGDKTNVRIYTSLLTLIKGSDNTLSKDELATKLKNAIETAWEERIDAIRLLSAADFAGFYYLRIKDSEAVIRDFERVLQELLDVDPENYKLEFNTKYFYKGVPLNKVAFYSAFVLTGSQIWRLRPVKADNKIKAVINEFKRNELGIRFNVSKIYDKKQWKEGVPELLTTSTFEAQKKVFTEGESSLMPAFIATKQENNAKVTCFSSNLFENYIGDTHKNIKITFGIIANDTTTGPLFIPMYAYSNNYDEGRATISDSLTNLSLAKTEGVLDLKDYFTLIDSVETPSFSAINDILNSIKINTTKKTIEFGYFLQKEESLRNISTSVPIQVTGTTSIADIIIKDNNNTSLNAVKDERNNNFIDANSYQLYNISGEITAIADFSYNVQNSDGTAINIEELGTQLNNKKAECDEINTIVLSQYNNYPDLDMIRYINEGRSIGYVNTNQDNQPAVTKFVDEILRWDSGISYSKNNVSIFDIKVNGEGFKKMYFVSCTESDIKSKFDFNDQGKEKSDPRVPVCYSITDSNNLLENYWERTYSDEDIEYETSQELQVNSNGNVSNTTVSETTVIGANSSEDSEESISPRPPVSGDPSKMVRIENKTINLGPYLNSSNVVTIKYGEGFKITGLAKTVKKIEAADSSIIDYNQDFIIGAAVGSTTLTLLGDENCTIDSEGNTTYSYETIGTINITVIDNPSFVPLTGISLYYNGNKITKYDNYFPANSTVSLFAYAEPENATCQYVYWGTSLPNQQGSFGTASENGNEFTFTTKAASDYCYRYITATMCSVGTNAGGKSQSLKAWVQNK